MGTELCLVLETALKKLLSFLKTFGIRQHNGVTCRECSENGHAHIKSHFRRRCVNRRLDFPFRLDGYEPVAAGLADRDVLGRLRRFTRLED